NKNKRETGREKPKTQPKQTNQHHTTKRHTVLDWQKSKHYRKPQRLPTGPIPDGAKQQDRQKISCANKMKHTTQNKRSGNHWFTQPPPAHTKSMRTHAAHNTKHTTTKNQMHWHTIEFSNNTSTPKPTHKHVGKSKVTKVFSSAIVFLPATQTREPICSPAGRCRSR
ncbi:hypothetical protein, partial [Corynebacterium lujinxingii]